MTTPSSRMVTARKGGGGIGSGCLWIGLNLLFALFLGIGGWFGYGSWRLTQNGGKADGTVVDLEAHNSDDGTSYSPIVEFIVDGTSYRMTSTNSSEPPAYHIGQAVRVVYDRDNPNVARIDNFWELWLLPLIFIPLALLFAVIYNLNALFGFIRGRRQPAAPPPGPVRIQI